MFWMTYKFLLFSFSCASRGEGGPADGVVDLSVGDLWTPWFRYLHCILTLLDFIYNKWRPNWTVKLSLLFGHKLRDIQCHHLLSPCSKITGNLKLFFAATKGFNHSKVLWVWLMEAAILGVYSLWDVQVDLCCFLLSPFVVHTFLLLSYYFAAQFDHSV